MLYIDTDLSLLLSAKVHHNHLAWHEGVMKFMRCKTSWSIDIWLTWTFQSMTQLWPKSNLLTNRNFLLFNSWVWSKRNVGQVFLLFFSSSIFCVDISDEWPKQSQSQLLNTKFVKPFEGKITKSSSVFYCLKILTTYSL